MNIESPAGTKIEVDRDIYSTTYFWKNGEKGLGQYPVAAFLIFWFCGWTVGGFMAVKAFFKGDDAPLFGRLFLLFWLGGWAVGEVAVAFILYSIFRPLKPAKLTLSKGLFEYQTGTKPFSFNYYTYHQSSQRPKFFQSISNKSYRIETRELKNLRLDRVGERQRLTFDMGIERIEIGETLSEPEREWLYEVLKRHISG